MPDRRSAAAFGALAEREAARFYERQGFRILERNLRTRRGEVDLIARRGELLVFVEVKARRREDFGDAAEAVDLGKQRRIADVAREYLARSGGPGGRDPEVRFDVIVVRTRLLGRLEVEHIPAAFDSDERDR